MARRRTGWGAVALAAVAPVVVALGLLATQAPAFARHNFSMLLAEHQEVAAGEEVAISGFSYTETAVVRFGAVDGPLLARLEPTDNEDIEGTVRIPPDTAPGRYILFAMHEDAAGEPARFPGQAAVTVVSEGGAPLDLRTGLELVERPMGLLVQNAVNVGALAVVALAVGGVGLLGVLGFGMVSRTGRPATGGQR